MEYFKQLVWHESKNVEGNITTWLGKVNDRVIYTICQFKNDMFTDTYIMTSNVVPIEMTKGDELEELKETAQILMVAFVKSFCIVKK